MPAIQTDLEPKRKLHLGAVISAPVLVIGFSIFYFADVLLRASEKYFWYDELFTVFLCRLDPRSLWHALQAGIDSNPPLFYILTKASNALFGEGLLSTRLPEIIGFWVFCVCLFYFVKRRASLTGGFIAMIIPVFTGAFYYAYDARPHGIVVGFCGLALVCWQMSLDEPWRGWWLTGFSLALFGAFMTHCYALSIAVPFGIAELVWGIKLWRVQWQRWMAIAVPGAIACLVYVPLLLSFKSVEKGTIFLSLSPLVRSQIADFYRFLLSPCILIVLITLVLLALKTAIGLRSPRQAESAPARILAITPEFVVALSFLALPVFGLLLAKTLGSPFYDRYFLSAAAGICILVGLAAGARSNANWIATALAAIFAVSLVWNVAHIVRHRSEGIAESLTEPSSGFSTNSSLAGPLASYSLLLSGGRQGLPIIVMWPMDFLYLLNYAPDLAPQLYYVGWNDADSFYRMFESFHRWSPVKYNTMKADDFFRMAPRFLLFAPDETHQISALMNGGARLKSLQTSDGRYLAEFESRLKQTSKVHPGTEEH